MTLVEWLTFAGVMTALLGVLVGIYGLINNHTVKSESRKTREMLENEMTANRQFLEKIEQGQEKMAHGLEKISEGQEDFKKSFTDAMRYLGDLIVADGERTRQAIKEVRPS